MCQLRHDGHLLALAGGGQALRLRRARKLLASRYPYSPKCVEGLFSEDEMRRPTPCAVPSEGLQRLYGL